MKRLLIAVAITALTPSLYGAPPSHPYGPNLSYGDISHGKTVLSNTTNPAATAEKLESSGKSWSMGFIPHIGVGVEFGDVNNLYDEIDDSADTIQQDLESFNAANPQQTADNVNNTIADTNRILQLVEEGGYGKAVTSLQIPFTPIGVSNVLGGALFFDASVLVTGRLGSVSDQINFSPADIENFITNGIPGGQTTFQSGDVNLTYDGTNVNFNIDNDSTAVLKAARILNLGLGYSRQLFGVNQGKLYGGVKGNFYRVQLVQDIQRLATIEEGSEDFFDDFDLGKGDTSTGIGLDFGVLWAVDRFKLGATLTNLNEPSFNYNSIDLSDFTDAHVKNVLATDTKYTMKRQLKLEGSMFILENVVLGASFDANAVEDPVGDEYQWLNGSVALINKGIIPGVRGGIRKNMAGSELSYLELGLTWLYFNIDIARAMENVQVDGDSIPRGAYINIGLEVEF